MFTLVRPEPARVVDGYPIARQLYRVPEEPSVSERFTSEEQETLAPYFGNVDSPVFALTNLPEVVKGALFARYSRSAKSVRRLFLDEFLGVVQTRASGHSTVGLDRAERLYARVFNEYGDDSVAQLGGAHVACEGVSNVLTKVLERGRLMAYLEQSTRYVPYTGRPAGRWKYVTPSELDHDGLRTEFATRLDRAFETYARWLPHTSGSLPTALPEVRKRHGWGVRSGDTSEGAGRAARTAPGSNAVQRRHLWLRTGL